MNITDKHVKTSNITNKRKQRLFNELKDKKYREAYVSNSVDVGVAIQIKALREHRKPKPWTQSDLATHANMQQERISVLENPSHSPTLSTLKKLANAFDIGLIVRFVPISELVKHQLDLSSESHQINLPSDSSGIPSFDQEDYFEEKPENESVGKV